jgi:hypothetical protein
MTRQWDSYGLFASALMQYAGWFFYLSVSAFPAFPSVKSCQLIGNGTFGDFALITQSCALFSASVKMGFFIYIFIPGYLCFL